MWRGWIEFSCAWVYLITVWVLSKVKTLSWWLEWQIKKWLWRQEAMTMHWNGSNLRSFLLSTEQKSSPLRYKIKIHVIDCKYMYFYQNILAKLPIFHWCLWKNKSTFCHSFPVNYAIYVASVAFALFKLEVHHHFIKASLPCIPLPQFSGWQWNSDCGKP